MFYAETHADRVDGWFDQALFVFVTAYDEGVQESFFRQAGFDFGVVVTFYYLGGKVLET